MCVLSGLTLQLQFFKMTSPHTLGMSKTECSCLPPCCLQLSNESESVAIADTMVPTTNFVCYKVTTQNTVAKIPTTDVIIQIELCDLKTVKDA